MQDTKKVQLFYVLMALAAFIIILLPVGIANFIFGYVLKDSPCTSCWVQRMSMIYIGVMAFFIVRYGFKAKYLATILVMTAVGLYQSFAHYGYHAHRDLDQGFSLQIFGIHTYFWSSVVFWVVILFLALLFYIAPKFKFFEEEMQGKSVRKLSKSFMTMFYISAFVIASNVFQALVSTGIPPYLGQGDPVRFSLNPKYIVWDTSGWKKTYASFSFLGSRDVKAPDYAFAPATNLGITFDNDSTNAPTNVDNALSIIETKEISLDAPLNTINKIYGEFVASSKWNIYFMDNELKVTDSVKIDPYFSATIDPLIGVVGFDNDKYIAMGSNKTLLRFKKNEKADDSVQFAQFLEGYDRFEGTGKGLGRARLSTVRAKFFHIGSIAIDDRYYYTATLPNNKNNKKFIISGVSLSDMDLSFEFTPKANLKEGKTLGDLYITAMVENDGKLYALSKNHNVIIVIDIKEQAVISTISFPSDIKNARGLIVNDDSFTILSYQDNKNMLYTLK